MSTITLPSGVEVEEGRILIVPGIGVVMPPGDLTAAEAAALRADVATAMNQNLDDLANVTEAGKITGMALAVQADGTWAPQNLTGVIERVTQNWTPVTHIDAVKQMIFGPGISVEQGGQPDRALMKIVFGASGSSDTVARADHRHPPTLKGRYQFNKAAAVLSTGTSSLVNQTVTGLVASVIYDVSVTGRLEAVNTNTSGRLYLRTQIGANTEQSVSRGFSGGVWTEVSADGTQMSVTGVTSLQLQFWAEYQSGDPTALYTGELVYDIAPRGGLTS